MHGFALALRLGRWGILGYGALTFLNTTLQAVGFYQIAGKTPAARAAFGSNMALLASQFTVLLPEPVRLDTIGGYVQWRAFGFYAIPFAIWALASATSAARADEERGLVEMVLSTGVSRTRFLTTRMAAFAAGSAIAALAGTAGLLIGVAIGRENFSAGPAFAATIPLVALALACYAITLAVSQLTSARSAVPIAGMLLLALFLLNSLSHNFGWLERWRLLSPFHYYELSQPLPPGGTVDVPATIVLVGITCVLALVAAVAFVRRDLNASLVTMRRTPALASHEPDAPRVWAMPVARLLYERRYELLAWIVGMSALAAIFVALTMSIVRPLLSIPELKPYLESFVHGSVFPSFVNLIWFGSAQLLMAGFAITQVAHWSAEDGDGRLEMFLSTPTSRLRVVVERLAALSVGAIAIAAVSGVVVAVAAHAQTFDLNGLRVVEASGLLIPFTLVFAVVGSLLATRLPRATVGVLTGFAFASYFALQLAPIFKWPDWAQDMSVFKLYGRPLTDGVDLPGLGIMLMIVAVGFAASVQVFRSRDVGS